MNAIRIAKVFTFRILLLFCLEPTFLVYPPVFVLGLSVIAAGLCVLPCRLKISIFPQERPHCQA